MMMMTVVVTDSRATTGVIKHSKTSTGRHYDNHIAVLPFLRIPTFVYVTMQLIVDVSELKDCTCQKKDNDTYHMLYSILTYTIHVILSDTQ